MAWALILCGSAPVLTGCGDEKRPPYFSAGGSSDGQLVGTPGLKIDEECIGPPELDTEGLCGNEVVQVTQEEPNLYFVVDTSGSMIEPIGSRTKLTETKSALITVARELGHRIKYGLATFPGPTSEDALLGCGPGEEVFETRPGDPLECLNQRGGPILDEFQAKVLALEAEGGTPLAPTLANLTPIFTDLEGRTSVLLMTDGAPNCNVSATCNADQCVPSIEEEQVPSGLCDDSYNCCDADDILAADQSVVGPLPQARCVDSAAALAQVQTLRDAGIDTYVIGVPGSEAYADLMNELAEAGGTARDGATDYYDVRDTDELREALLQVGSTVAQSCSIDLEKEPPQASLVNVYLDAELLAADPADGWSLEEATVTLHGDACTRVQSGEVTQIQVVSGCQTVVK